MRSPAGPKPRRELTPIWPASTRTTNRAPVTNPHEGPTRPERWDVYSRDELWHYERQDGLPRIFWTAIFLPTGQRREWLPNLADARAATAAGLVDQLRREAFALALRSRLDDPDREKGHRWLAIHMRVAKTVQGDEADHRCVCGGFLAVVTREGDVAHLDACDRCYTYGRKLPTEQCPAAADHKFCGDPLVAGLQIGCGLWRELCCPGDCMPPA